MYEFINFGIDKSVATITLDRAEKRNALTRKYIQELSDSVDRVQADESIRLLVLRAAGTVFCAGMDLTEMKSRALADNPEKEWQTDSEVYNELVSKIFALPIPTLAVLPGPVLAGGTGMVFACDLVLAADNAFISLPEPKRGIVAAMVCPLLMHRTNLSTASYLLLSGKPLTADEAHKQGLFHEVVPPEELENAERTLVQTTLSGSPSALALAKSHLKKVANVDVLQQIKDSAVISAQARRSADAREGLAAFVEKRPPRWEEKSAE